MRAWLTLLTLGLAITTSAETVPLDKIVPSYMGDGLETAIIPTPKQTALADTALPIVQAPTCVAPEVLVKAHLALKESGLAEDRQKLLLTEFENQRERAQAFRGFSEQWKAVSEKVQAKGWPSPLAFAMEVQEAFPGVEFSTHAPGKTDRPLLLLVVEGLSDSLKSAVGEALPDLPKVADELCAQERYVVLSDSSGGRPRMVSYGATPWAVLWGLQTLRQMVFEHEGRRYVRQGTVVDYPTLWFRGGKRCKDWWVRYKGNGRFENWDFQFGMRHVPRSHSSVVSAKPKHLERHKQNLAKAVQQGAGFFLLDFNDGRFWTSDKETEPFPGDPAKTVKHLLQELNKERERLRSDIRIGYMPVAYAINRGSEREGKMLREVKALEGVPFVMMNGLEVFTYRFPYEGAAAYREAFGIDGKLLMYDCQSCRRNLRTPDYKDPRVHEHLHGISAQSSSPVFFIGLADYTWSPETYDPARALKLAARELADRDPEQYRRLYDYLSYYVANSYLDKFMPREKTLALHKQHTDGMVNRLEALAPLFEQGRMARETDLAAYITAPGRARADAWEMTEKHGFKDYRVKRAPEIAVDGKLDEDAWQKAPKMDTFFPAVDIKGMDDKPLPSEGRAIVARALYDEKALYMAYEVEGTSEEMMKYVRGSVAGELTEKDPKKKPVFEIFIKPDLTDVVRWQLMHFVPEGHSTFVKHYFDPKDPLGANRVEHTPEIRCSVTGETSYVTEVRIPYWKGMKPATKGDVWGVQLQMNRALAHRDTPYWLYHWTYSHDRDGLWAYEYSYGRWLFE